MLDSQAFVFSSTVSLSDQGDSIVYSENEIKTWIYVTNMIKTRVFNVHTVLLLRWRVPHVIIVLWVIICIYKSTSDVYLLTFSGSGTRCFILK